jgi:hypothetical protein
MTDAYDLDGNFDPRNPTLWFHLKIKQIISYFVVFNICVNIW